MTARPPKPSLSPVTIVGLGLAQGLVFFDISAMGAALPTIARELQLSPPAAIWVVNAFFVAYGGFVAVGGRLVASVGTRAVLLVGVSLFTLGSALAGALPAGVGSPEIWLVGWRLVQGLGAALITPSTAAMILEGAPKHERGRTMALFVNIGQSLFVAGPFLGGLLVQHISWRAVFFAALPAAPLALTVLRSGRATAAVGARRAAPLRAAFLARGVLLAGLLGTVVASLASITHPPSNDALMLAILLCGVALLSFFLWWEQRRADPILQLSPFRLPAFRFRLALFALVQVFVATSLIFVPQALQTEHSLSPGEAGLWMLAMLGGWTLTVPVSGRLYDRFGAGPLLLAGTPLTTAAMVVVALSLPTQNAALSLVALAVCGVGLGLSVTPSYTATISTRTGTPPGSVIGMAQTVRRIGGAVAIALLSGVFAHTAVLHGNSTMLAAGALFAIAAVGAVTTLLAVFAVAFSAYEVPSR